MDRPGPLLPEGAAVLVAEDEESLRDLVCTALRLDGLTPVGVSDGLEAWNLLQRRTFDLVILDVMMPGLDGFEVLERLRESPRRPPVLFLTARDAVEDRVRGLTGGADDYLGKPFAVAELLARVGVILRRHGVDPDRLVVGDLVIEPDAARVTRAGTEVVLTPTEFRLLVELAGHSGQVLSKQQLLDRVWNSEHAGDPNVVETYVSYLRRKLDPLGPPLIETVRGFGYMLRPVPSAPAGS